MLRRRSVETSVVRVEDRARGSDVPARRRTNGGMVRDGIQVARSGAQVELPGMREERKTRRRVSIVSSGTWHDLAVYVSE